MKIFKFKHNKEAGAVALGMSVIFGIGVTAISMMSQQRQLNTTMTLNQLSVKHVLTAAIKDGVRELGVFVPTGLVSWDGKTFSVSPDAPQNLPWSNAGANLQKQGCVQPVSQMSDCLPDDTYKIIAKVVGSPTRTLADGSVEKFLELQVTADIHKTVHDARIETELGVYIKQPDVSTGSSLCAYADPGVPFVPTYFNIRASRWAFIGWAKVKPMQSLGSDATYTVRLDNWETTNDREHDHNGYFPSSNATIQTSSYYLKVNGWWSWASLVIPRAKPNECVLHVQGFRRNGYRLGCFAQDTEIAVSPTENRYVQTLGKGDTVYNPKTGRYHKIKNVIAGPEEEKDMVEIRYDEAKLLVTLDHPMPTERGLIQAADLVENDKVQIANGDWVPVSVRRIPSEGQIVYNFALEGDENEDSHMVVANSIVTGDLDLQDMLLEKKHTVSTQEVVER